jgi:CRP/FNR family cyclic AMP-dependent transcriptional regulator
VTKTEAARLLSGVPLFSSLSKKELNSLAAAVKDVSHPAGHVIARQGEIGVGFFLIVEGSAKVTVNGRPRSKLGPGDWFGEISLLDEGPRTATVTADTPIVMLGLTSWVFRRLVEENPSVATKMLKVMATRLRGASQDLSH